jgi:NAD(P)-dependent dehydrogenase (short-subunit alcohol dehydrogenase family)
MPSSVTDRRAFLGAAAAAAVADGVPRSSFGEDSTAEEVTAGIDLSGRLAVVTGCTSGIGYETMRVLALRGAMVVGTSRSPGRAREACSGVRGTTVPLQLELGDYGSIVACANAIRSINLPLDILVCNAGYLGAGGEREIVNGVEKHLAVNHLGHFVLVNRLLGRSYMADQGRIVVVGSRAGYRSAPDAGIEFDNLDGARDYDDRRAYGHSKLANALFALHLARLLRGTRITANVLHPGVINTEIDRNMNRFKQSAFAVATWFGYGKTVEQGAATSCFVATSPLLGSTSGRYFEDCNAVRIVGSHIHDEVMAERLWQVSEELTRDWLVSHSGPDYNDFERAGIERRKRLEAGD